MIEQAIFTSAETNRLRGYQLVAASSGISAPLARELTTWGPSHESLCDAREGASSVNFHPLGGNRWCVSQSVADGEEYSGRGGTRVYSQSFIAGVEELAPFANNPFALLRAVRDRGLLSVRNPIPTQLEPFSLPGRAAPVDEGVLAEFIERLGAQRVAWLVDAALASDQLLVVGAENRELVAAGLLNVLPVECRPEMSLATGLVYSPRRPFKVNVLRLDAVDARRLSRQSGVTVLNLCDEPPSDFVPSGWAAYLFEALALDGLPLVCGELERPRTGLRLSDLAWLAEELTDRLHAAPSMKIDRGAPEIDDLPRQGDARRVAHAAHFSSNAPAPAVEVPERLSTEASTPKATSRPSTEIPATSRETIELLEQMDDLVFDTISGRRPALDELTALWPRLLAELPVDLLAESREQYLRYAIKLWESCVGDENRDATWAVAALDVLCLLFGES
jgi:GTPase-associated protein 1